MINLALKAYLSCHFVRIHPMFEIWLDACTARYVDLLSTVEDGMNQLLKGLSKAVPTSVAHMGWGQRGPLCDSRSQGTAWNVPIVSGLTQSLIEHPSTYIPTLA